MASEGPVVDVVARHVCVIADIAQPLPMQQIALSLAPAGETASFTPEQKRLHETYGLRMVATKLKVFKEKLRSKFGIVEFSVALERRGDAPVPPDPAAIADARVALVAQTQRAAAANTFRSLFPSDALWTAVGETPLVGKAKDAAMMQAFVLQKIVAAPTEAAPSPAKDGGDKAAAAPAELAVASFSAIELAWLRGQHADFPETATAASLNEFFEGQSRGLIASGLCAFKAA